MELRHLRYFLAVAEEQSFTRAAEKLLIAQPPLSFQIKQLEREIGVKLFVRSGRGISLTRAGVALKEGATKIMSLAAGTVEAARKVGRGEAGQLDVGVVGSAAYTRIPFAIGKFRQTHPDVSLRLWELSTPKQIELLLDSKLDVAIVRSSSITFAGVKTNVLVNEPFVAAVPRKHPLARVKKAKPALLANENFIVYPRDERPGLYVQVLKICEQAGFEPRIVQQSSQIPTILSLVAAGLGIAIVPASVLNTPWKGVIPLPLVTSYRSEIAVAALQSCDNPAAKPFLQSLLE
ncbi:MAG: LysR substrate-binding domain-containing protein [Pirellulales bacterium]|nr:LysR substrate-binding domain-containing protein [Pirellulales bacterium]